MARQAALRRGTGRVLAVQSLGEPVTVAPPVIRRASTGKHASPAQPMILMPSADTHSADPKAPPPDPVCRHANEGTRPCHASTSRVDLERGVRGVTERRWRTRRLANVAPLVRILPGARGRAHRTWARRASGLQTVGQVARGVAGREGAKPPLILCPLRWDS